MPERLRDAQCWIFDLDNTLYPSACNLFEQVDRRIQKFVMDRLQVGPDEARRVQKDYFHQFGTTLNGLIQNHAVEPAEYLDYVHDIDVTPVPPSPALDAALGRLPGRKLVYTNGSDPHAARVMDRLGVSHHFDAVFDIVAADYVPKPDPAAYDELMRRFDIAAESAVMVEDIARNLAPAHARGIATVWLRSDHHWSGGSADDPHIDYVIDDLVEWLDRVAPKEGGRSG